MRKLMLTTMLTVSAGAFAACGSQPNVPNKPAASPTPAVVASPVPSPAGSPVPAPTGTPAKTATPPKVIQKIDNTNMKKDPAPAATPK